MINIHSSINLNVIQKIDNIKKNFRKNGRYPGGDLN
jgi:hypothetical protein